MRGIRVPDQKFSFAARLIKATTALPICQVDKVRGPCRRSGNYHRRARKFPEKYSLPEGREVNAGGDEIEGKGGGGGERKGGGRKRERNSTTRVEGRKMCGGEKGKGCRGEKEEGEERGKERAVGGGNSGVHRPHWQQQWHPPSHPTDTTELLDKL